MKLQRSGRSNSRERPSKAANIFGLQTYSPAFITDVAVPKGNPQDNRYSPSSMLEKANRCPSSTVCEIENFRPSH